MADYPTLNLPTGASPAQAAAAAEDVTWQVTSGAVRISTRAALQGVDTSGIVLRAGSSLTGVTITANKAVWYWPIGGAATLVREAL